LPTEIVRLPVRPGGQTAVASYLSGQVYFGQPGLRAHRILRAAERAEVALILDWESREAAQAALHSAIGQSFVEGLTPMLAGPPELAYYEAVE
jgi:heme-degrading monooxygenase HmoA